MDHTQQTVRESSKGSSQQKDEVILIQTHLRGTVKQIRQWKKLVKLNMIVLCGSCLPITLCTRVAERLVSALDGDGTTPSDDHSHDTVGQGVDKLTRMEQLTQQGNFRACDSWND